MELSKLLIVRETKVVAVMTNEEEKNRDNKDKKEKFLAITQPIKISRTEKEKKDKFPVNLIIIPTTIAITIIVRKLITIN